MTPLILLLAIVSPTLIAASQTLLKFGANRHGDRAFLRQYLNLPVISAYTLFAGATVINVYIFSVAPLSFGNIMIAFSYIFVTLLSSFALREHISPKRLGGILITTGGVLLYGIGL